MIKTYKYPLLMVGLWSVLLVSWFVWFAHDEQHETTENAVIQGRSTIEKDILYRRWNAMMGGIYAPVSDTLQPNPHLANLPQRDVTTLSGKKLTLINPAYMARMVFDLGVKAGLYTGHITSLNPIRPENRADLWETEALQHFNDGGDETFSVVEDRGQKIMRVMRPLKTEVSCLKCHGSQGYKVGDVRGGISVSVPMEMYEIEALEHIRSVGLGILILWFLGCMGIFVVSMSMAEKRRDLEKAASEWKTTFDSITDFVSVHDKDFRFTRVNKALAEYLGKTPKELLGRKCFEDIHCTKEPYPNCPLEETIRTGKTATLEIEDKRIGIPLLVTTSPIKDGENNLSGYVHIAKDMTETKKILDVLKESEIRYKALFEQAPLGYQSLDENGFVLVVNEAWLDLLGYKEKEVLGKSFGDFVDPTWRAHFVENFPRFKAIGEILGVEFEMVRKDGSKILVAINGKIGLDQSGNFQRTHCILHNISEERQRQEELNGYRDTLEQRVAERTRELEEMHNKLVVKEKLAAIGKLSGSVAHDIRNPLGAISNSIYFLNAVTDEKTDEKIRKHISIMEREVSRASGIISDLLDFSRVNEPGLVKGNLNTLIQEYIDRLDPVDNVKVKAKLDQAITVFLFDPTQILRILDNLTSNSIQAMPEGGQIEIVTRLLDQNVEIEIRDSGVGIKKENFTNIFEPLFTTKAKGVGLGLSIIKTFVENHGGKIAVESEVGKGTTFTLKLPFKTENPS